MAQETAGASADISERIREIIATELQVDKAEVRPDATIADLGGDSLRALMIVSALENNFDITIADEDGMKITSFKSAIATVQRLLAE